MKTLSRVLVPIFVVAAALPAATRAGTVVSITNGYFGTTGTPPAGWVDVDGTPTIRSFNASGQRMISTSGTAPYQARQTTSTPVAADTTYLLEFDQGFGASTNRSDNYTVQIGSSSAGFTSLGSKSGTLTSTSASANFGADNAHYNSLQVTTGGSVSGNLAVQLEVDSNNAWLGYDNVHLTAFASNEVVIANHSFDMSSRDNQGTLVGGLDNLAGWTEVSGATSNDDARGFSSNGFRSLIGFQVSDTFTAEQVTGAFIQANTQYSMTVDIGFMQSGAGTGDYLLELGTSNGGVFTMLAELDSTLEQVVSSEYNISLGNAAEVEVLLNTGATVSGDALAIRLTKEDATTFFGFDEVVLTHAPIPEPSATWLAALATLGLLRRRR